MCYLKRKKMLADLFFVPRQVPISGIVVMKCCFTRRKLVALCTIMKNVVIIAIAVTEQ